MAAFRGELNRAFIRVLQLGYQRPMKRHLAPVVWGELCLIIRLSAKVKLKYKYDRKEDPEFILVHLFEQGNSVQFRVNAIYADDESRESSSGARRLSECFVAHTWVVS